MARRINPNFKHLVTSYKKGYAGAILEGGSRCFSLDQKVLTPLGPVEISKLKIGDLVNTYNHKLDIIEPKRVVNVIRQDNKKKAYKIKLKDGTIIKCTEDHKFYFNGGYNEIKNILSLWQKENDRKMV